MIASLMAGAGASAQPAPTPPAARPASGVSPALCGRGAVPEPGIQGEVPAGQKAAYHCGVRVIGQLAVAGSVAGTGRCPYVRARPSALGWGFEAFVSDVTDPANARNVSMLRLAINEPEYCAIRKASGRDPWIAYHLIDDPMNAHFAAVNFGEAGLRIFDIRNPMKPAEVAYFNHGSPLHGVIGHYDGARKLIYFSDAGGFKVLQIEPQVRARLGL